MNRKKWFLKPIVSLLIASIILNGSAPADGAEENRQTAEAAGYEELLEEKIVRDSSQYVNNEILVAFSSGDAKSAEYIDADAEEEEINRAFLDRIDGVDIKDYFEGCALISIEDKERLEAVVKELSEAEGVAYLQPNYTYSVSKNPSSEPFFQKQWGIYNDGSFGVPGNDEKNAWGSMEAEAGMDVNGKEAWNFFEDGGREVIVAQIDTGIDTAHEDLAENLWVNEDEIANGRDSDGNGYADDRFGWNFYDNNNDPSAGGKGERDHGTHVAGIIAGVNNGIGVAGVAANLPIKLMPIKALGGAEGVGNSISIMKAIKYAQDNGADICNMSFGLEQEDPLLKASMKNSRMLFVVAAGNGIKRTGNLGYNIDLIPNYPAASDLENIISVANMNFSGNLDASSCYGPNSVDIVAPGTYIYSTLPENKYGFMTGTSMAAPMVTGAAAMVYSFYSGITPHQVREILLSSAKEVEALYGKVSTGGMLDIYAALTAYPPDKYKKGTPPVIRSEVKKRKDSYKKELSVRITDEEEDLDKIYFAEGERTRAYFEKEGKGTEIAVTKGGRIEKDIPITKTGYYTLYASDIAGNVSMSKKLVNIKTVKLMVESKTMKQGDTYQLNAVLTPEFYSGTILYTSSNSSIATVHRTSGKVKALKKGTVTITARVTGGKPDTCRIRVEG